MSSQASRFLVVTADDFGIGSETTRGILELATRGVVTSTVLLVNSPFAEEGVAVWRAAGQPVELGWHPCLTIDAPVLPPGKVPSLVGSDGRFPSLGTLLKRLTFGRVREVELHAELRAQYERFIDLVGTPPANVNGHHHIHVFRQVGDILTRVLAEFPRPFVRRVIEPLRTLRKVPGARIKRVILSWQGRRAARRYHATGLPGNDTLLGVTDPPFTEKPDFFTRWLSSATGRFVELSCHPGHFDATLAGRDGTLADGLIHRRARELALLSQPEFLDAVRANGFTLVNAAELVRQMSAEPTAIVRQAA